MEGKKLEKKLRDWASDLSFTLPNGSAPPANYFALLTATPHRRQLWEALIESVQPRQKIEHMRKQIMVAKLKDRKKHSRKCDSAPVMDRIQLWQKQSTLENQISEKGNAVIKLERLIVAKVSDVLFEICKLAELEKAYEEYSQKALTLRLFTKREKDAKKDLEKILLKVRESASCSEHSEIDGSKNNVDPKKNELLGVQEFMNPSNHGQDSELGKKLKELCKSEIPEQDLWDEVISCKRILLDKLSAVLEELNSNENSALSEKEVEAEKSLNASVRQLKQKATEKSLQVILNSTERQTLDWEIDKLGERLREGEPRGSLNGTFNDAISPLVTGGTGDCLSYDGRATKSVEKCASAVGLRCYKEFLREELKRLGEEVARAAGKAELKEAETEVEQSVNAVASFSVPLENNLGTMLQDCIVQKIKSKRSKEEEVAREILDSHGRLMSLLMSLREEAEVKERTNAIEDAEKVKSASGKLIDVFMDTPLDAFRTVDSHSGRLLFECESLSHCLSSYGGELNQFFSAILIPPHPDSLPILSEVQARQKMLTEARNVIRRRDDLAEELRKIRHRMDSMTMDTRLCERNFQESADILVSVLSKTDDLLRETDFIESILRNWVEQPYRCMAGQT